MYVCMTSVVQSNPYFSEFFLDFFNCCMVNNIQSCNFIQFFCLMIKQIRNWFKSGYQYACLDKNCRYTLCNFQGKLEYCLFMHNYRGGRTVTTSAQANTKNVILGKYTIHTFSIRFFSKKVNHICLLQTHIFDFFVRSIPFHRGTLCKQM